MSSSDPELGRLEKAEQEAQARYLRLESFHDVQVVQAARELWQSALCALEGYRARRNAPGADEASPS
jgi:DNA/RNA-binding domain of Phe-tRNA-synthetase-like protein